MACQKRQFSIKPDQLEEKDENGDYKIGVDPELTSEIQSMMGPTVRALLWFKTNQRSKVI